MEPHNHSNQVTAFNSPATSADKGAIVLPDESKPSLSMTPTPSKHQTVLLDLSDDQDSARAWILRQLNSDQFYVLDKNSLKWRSKRSALQLIRSLEPRTLALFTSNISKQSSLRAMVVFAAVAGAGRIVVGDTDGSHRARSRISALTVEATLLMFEFIAAYAVVVPLSWLLTLVLRPMIKLRDLTRRMFRQRAPGADGGPILFLNAAFSSSGAVLAGGMATHVRGFLRGVTALDRRVKLLNSSDSPIAQDRMEREAVARPPSIGPTRASFELYHNLRFTASAIDSIRSRAFGRGPAFIYQRYNRFNCTGAALSAITCLPLALEFNGSEVWVARHWDPVGQLPLLDRIERLNLIAADRIFVVSEVQKASLIANGIDSDKIVVNPNGVDTQCFRPNVGGSELRKQLRIEDKLVIGFAGTFGPWHGAAVLAEAIVGLHIEARSRSGLHAIFIGDGEQRSTTEQIFRAAKIDSAVTFTGRLPHELVPSYLDACDVLVAPHMPLADGTEFFGSPTKLFEYMAMERPVIASRLGQIADVIIDGVNGLLVPPASVGALQEAIKNIEADPQLRLRLGAAARETVIAGFTWIHNAKRVLDEMDQFRV